MKKVLRRVAQVLAVLVVGLLVSVGFGNDAIRMFEGDEPSDSHGTTSAGSLEHGKRLPTAGPNFRAYSRLAALIGRNAVHHAVRDTVIDAYAHLDDEGVDHRFVYGETGWPSGGPFPPHKTHQNGLCVDFMVPLIDADGESRRFPTGPHTRFGYDLEFDERGVRGGHTIDFASIATHLLALDEAAGSSGLAIARVIIAPEYIARVTAADETGRVAARIPFMQGEAWVRHDEHYHVDFALIR